MASRKSRRGRKKKGGFGKLVFVAAFLIAGAAGGWFAFGPDDSTDTTEAGISDLIPGLDEEGSSADTSDGEGDSQSLAEIESLLNDINVELAGTSGKDREKALRGSYKRLAKMLENPLPVEERARAIELFHSITDELFLSPAHNEFSENYLVKSGDSYDRIARAHRISTSLLYDLNGRSRGSTDLHPNENLKVPKDEPRVVVRKRDFTTSVYIGKYLVRQYIVAHGKNDNTPEGVTEITSMTLDPEKSSRGPNDPVNEMKLRWIGLDTYGGNRSGIGFHGTQYPDSIPGMTSRGCIRMHDSDVVELYDIVRIGNKVEVKS